MESYTLHTFSRADLHFEICIGSQRYSTQESDFPNNFQPSLSKRKDTLHFSLTIQFLLTMQSLYSLPVSSLFTS